MPAKNCTKCGKKWTKDPFCGGCGEQNPNTSKKKSKKRGRSADSDDRNASDHDGFQYDIDPSKFIPNSATKQLDDLRKRQRRETTFHSEQTVPQTSHSKARKANEWVEESKHQMQGHQEKARKRDGEARGDKMKNGGYGFNPHNDPVEDFIVEYYHTPPAPEAVGKSNRPYYMQFDPQNSLESPEIIDQYIRTHCTATKEWKEHEHIYNNHVELDPTRLAYFAHTQPNVKVPVPINVQKGALVADLIRFVKRTSGGKTIVICLMIPVRPWTPPRDADKNEGPATVPRKSVVTKKSTRSKKLLKRKRTGKIAPVTYDATGSFVSVKQEPDDNPGLPVGSDPKKSYDVDFDEDGSFVAPKKEKADNLMAIPRFDGEAIDLTGDDYQPIAPMVSKADDSDTEVKYKKESDHGGASEDEDKDDDGDDYTDDDEDEFEDKEPLQENLMGRGFRGKKAVTRLIDEIVKE